MDIWYPKPNIRRQKRAMGCWYYSLKMMFGIHEGEEKVSKVVTDAVKYAKLKKLESNFFGRSYTEIDDCLPDGYQVLNAAKTYWTRANIATYLKDHGPFMGGGKVLLGQGHAFVIYGLKGNNILCADPFLGDRSVSLTDYARQNDGEVVYKQDGGKLMSYFS